MGVVLALGVLAGCAVSDPSSAERSSDGSGHDDADVAFATAMVPHHEQAVAMARLGVDRAASPDLKMLARQIDAEQRPEISQLEDLLSGWGRPVARASSEMAAMPGMSGTDEHGTGRGMMTDQQMRDLTAASGPAFDRLFLKMMIKHHGGAVEMAETELSDGQNGDAQLLAQNISDSQQAETTLMIQMLADH